VSEPRWRKASFSQPNDDCVELALLEDGSIGVRDSKDGGQGPVLIFSRAEMRAFLAGVRGGEFDGLITTAQGR
jgi:hypothetical protein